jgi:hypothetical protein
MNSVVGAEGGRLVDKVCTYVPLQLTLKAKTRSLLCWHSLTAAALSPSLRIPNIAQIIRYQGTFVIL